MAEIGNVTVKVDTAITDERYFEVMGAVRAASERIDLLETENAKLRELAVGMAERVTNPTGGCLAPGCALGCPHHLECNEELHTCWYVDRMRELGIEVRSSER